MAATTVMEFTDRVFLANFSIDAIAASMPAGIAALLFLSFFTGIAGYLNVFVAQYTGAGDHGRVGGCIWQGLYFSLFAGGVLALISFFAKPLFILGGHSPEIQHLEIIYFKVLCLGGGTSVAAAALACFYSGRGHTRPVMIISIIGMLFNIPLDYALINGVWIFPKWGIFGAGIATVSAWLLMLLLYAILIFTRENNHHFSVFSQHKFDGDLFKRLLKFGIPGSMQFCVDIFAFTFFVFMVGRIGTIELAITNIVMSINSLAFMPTMGFSLGVSTLVGQAMGRGNVADAVIAGHKTLRILLVYIFFLVFVFILTPGPLLDLFIAADKGTAAYAAMSGKGVILLRIVALYVFFDAFYMIYTGLLKGAGDTNFIMWIMGINSFAVMIFPIYIGVTYFGRGIYYSWGCATAFIVSVCILSIWRYRQGKWKTMRVIETRP
jgi:MATE family multidrug resistance protein